MEERAPERTAAPQLGILGQKPFVAHNPRHEFLTVRPGYEPARQIS